MTATNSSSINSPAFTNTSPETGWTTFWAAPRPSTCSPRDEISSPPSITVRTVIPRSVSQSCSTMMQSWATSTRRRVRYPELAVFKAVSARPLRAPWVELKYSSTLKPSLKLEMIGVSMISPEGLAMRPRMPANCRIWATEPRAPEWAIMYTEFTGRPGAVAEIPSIISSATWSVQWDQASTTLLYFSPRVIRPSRYCCSYSLTFCSVSLTRISLVWGTTRSSLPNDRPARQA